MLGTISRWGRPTAVVDAGRDQVPSDGAGAGTPAPRNESADSRTTAFATSTVRRTKSVAHRCGSSSDR